MFPRTLLFFVDSADFFLLFGAGAVSFAGAARELEDNESRVARMLLGLDLSAKQEHVNAFRLPNRGVLGLSTRTPWLTLTA
jgi:hypothetical protein